MQIGLINYKKLEYVFEILHLFLQNGIINKVIHKKEFMIIHFSQAFHLDFLICPLFFNTLNLYYHFKKPEYKLFEVYYGAILTYHDQKRLIPLVVSYQNKLYVFDSSNDLTYDLGSDVVIVHLFNLATCQNNFNSDVKMFRLFWSDSKYLEQIKKIIVT